MTRTVKHLAEVIIDQAAAIGLEAEALDGDTIVAAEAIIAMRDASGLISRAREALQRAASIAKGRKPEASELFIEP